MEVNNMKDKIKLLITEIRDDFDSIHYKESKDEKQYRDDKDGHLSL